MRSFLRFVVLVLLAGVCAAAPPDTSRQAIFESFSQGDYGRAVTLIEEYLEAAPNDATMIYNLACAHCLGGKLDEAASALHRALKAGFADVEHLRRDPDLEALRNHPTYRRILEAADRAAAGRTRNALARWRETYGTDDYRYETDEERRISYATALDKESHQEMRAMLEQQADQLIETLFEKPPNYSFLIAVPTPLDAEAFFNGDSTIGGMYQHGPRQLVVRDIGGSLRHEFVHALHYGHMERLNQPHPVWIQEGLAALYEDYEINADGTFIFLPNERQVIAKSRGKAGRLTKWSTLFSMSAEEFMDQAPRLYPQVRSIFEFLADQDQLADWYKAYTENFEDDRSGAQAFEHVFELPLKDVERQWRRWLMRQPEVDLRLGERDAALGIRSREHAENDGVLITHVVSGSAASQARLRTGDVIVSVDDIATRTLMELRRIIASRQVGDTVDVRVRRNGQYLNFAIRLRPLYEPR